MQTKQQRERAFNEVAFTGATRERVWGQLRLAQPLKATAPAAG